MSPPQRKQNNSRKISPKSKKPDNSQRSTLQKQSATTVQNKTKKNETKSVSTVSTSQPKSFTSAAVNDQSDTCVEAGEMSEDFLLACHQDFVIRKMLYDGTKSRNTDKDNVCQHVCSNRLEANQNKNKKDNNELSAYIDSLWDVLQQVGNNAEEKLQMCKQFEMDFQNDYDIMVSALHTILESIGETQVETKDVFDATMKQLELHEKKIRQFDRKVEKVSTEIDHYTELRDDGCHQIAKTNQLLDVICTLVNDLKKSNNESNNQIDEANSQFNGENAVISDTLTNISQRLKEKTNAIAKMNQEKAALKLEEQKLMSSLASDKVGYENVCAKVIDLSKEIDRQAMLITRIQTANTNLRNDHTEYSKLKQMRADLSDELKTVDAALQNEVDEKQRSIDDIKQITEEISMKQQHRNEMQITLHHLENEIRKQTLVRDYLDECEHKVFVAKRPRLSSSSFSSIFTEINEIMNQGDDAESENDTPKFNLNSFISEDIIDSRGNLSTFDQKAEQQ